MPSVHCVTRSCTKLKRMRGENCVDASVSVIRRMANTIDTTVMIEVAMLVRIALATGAMQTFEFRFGHLTLYAFFGNSR